MFVKLVEYGIFEKQGFTERHEQVAQDLGLKRAVVASQLRFQASILVMVTLQGPQTTSQ